ncbi:B-type flagellar hook-associated protein 2 [marine metagenome]
METDYLQALGVGAGFDTKKIVTALVTAEKAGKQSAIDRRTVDVDANVSGMATLKSSLQTLQTAIQKLDDKNEFNFSSLTNSSPSVVTASFDSSISLPGTYKVSVSQLAQNDVYQASAVSDVLATATMTISGAAIKATDTMTMTAGTATFAHTFTTSSQTLTANADEYVAAWNASTDANVSLFTASNVAGAITITQDKATAGALTVAGSVSRVGGSSDVAIATAAAAGATGVSAVAADQNGTSAATVVIQVGSGAAETITLASGSTSLTDLVTGINALTADVSARLVETSSGTYRVVVEGPQGSDNALTITDSVFGLQTTNVPEVDTYTLNTGVATNGSAVFTFNGTTYTQTFTSSDAATLTALMAQINAADPSVNAANGTSGTAFTITSSVGSDTQMTKGTIGGTSDGSADLTISTADTTNGSDGNKIQTAQNATLSVNGLSISSSSNSVKAVVPGLELNLLATTNTPVVMSVSRDTSVAKQAITDLVAAYNTFDGAFKGLTAVGSTTTEEGSLKSDSSIRAIRERVRNFLIADSSTPGTTKQGLTDIGISLQRNGSFLVDSTALGAALSSNYSDITKMFSGNTNNQSSYSTDGRGIAGDIVNEISGYLAYDGIVKLREKTYATTKATLATDQTALDKKMVSIEARYTKQFSTMSKIMDEMKSTQEYLESQLDNLPFTSNND